jgi:hypothetical protein
MPPTRQAASRHSTRSTTRPPPSRIERVRVNMNQMFSGRSTLGMQSSPPESPKTPRLALGLNNLSSTRLVIPHLTRTTPPSPNSPRPPSGLAPNDEIPTYSEPTAPDPARLQPAYHDIAVLSVQTRHNSARRFVDPAEEHLAELAGEARRRRHKTTAGGRRCATKTKSKKMRSKILTCFISGIVDHPLNLRYTFDG